MQFYAVHAPTGLSDPECARSQAWAIVRRAHVRRAWAHVLQAHDRRRAAIVRQHSVVLFLPFPFQFPAELMYLS
jgi:hypothetical protein